MRTETRRTELAQFARCWPRKRFPEQLRTVTIYVLLSIAFVVYTWLCILVASGGL